MNPYICDRCQSGFKFLNRHYVLSCLSFRLPSKQFTGADYGIVKILT